MTVGTVWERIRRPLAMIAFLPLAFWWYGAVITLLFPIGGGEYHWLGGLARTGRDTLPAVLTVLADYFFVTVAFLLVLASRAVWHASLVVLATVVVATAASGDWLAGAMRDTGPFILAIAAVLAVLAAASWRLRRFLPAPFMVVVASAPGTWAMFDLVGAPYSALFAFTCVGTSLLARRMATKRQLSASAQNASRA